jgi:hypothetical protein
MTYSQCSGSWVRALSREACRWQVYSLAGRFKEVNVGMPTVPG